MITKNYSRASRDARELSKIVKTHGISRYEFNPQSGRGRILGYDCGCNTCDLWRCRQLVPGTMVRGINLDPKRYKDRIDSIPVWAHDGPVSWVQRRLYWNYIATFLGPVGKDHRAKYVDGCYILIPGIPGIWCVSANKLRTVP